MSATKYIGSNVFIYAVLYNDKRASACRRVLADIVSGTVDAVTNTLTWDEFTFIVERTLGREVSVPEGERFLRFHDDFARFYAKEVGPSMLRAKLSHWSASSAIGSLPLATNRNVPTKRTTCPQWPLRIHVRRLPSGTCLAMFLIKVQQISIAHCLREVHKAAT